jgi:hypothetical protein
MVVPLIPLGVSVIVGREIVPADSLFQRVQPPAAQPLPDYAYRKIVGRRTAFDVY